MSLVCAVSRSARSGLSRTASFSLGSQISTGFRNEKLRPNQFRAFTTNRPTGPVSSGVRGPQPPPPPPPGNSGPQTGGGSGTFAKEITDATFSRDVVQASMRTPVIVDCHADWCHPCKQLRPVLEKEVKARGGFSLVTIDIDKNPNIAQALQVTELPTVMAVFQGKAVDVFVGALPPAEVSKWFTRVCAKLGMKPNPAANGESMEQVLKKAFDMAEQGDIDQAAELLGAVLKDEELAKAHSPAAKAGIIVCSIGRGDFSGARSVAADVRQNHKDNLNMPLVKRALAMVCVSFTKKSSNLIRIYSSVA
eukprot:c9167_g1_i2.p1 GENE.c9167_g1_i2~~c9167_g1_i2.p1  ORF type:complete len:307 (+),score=90.88 c9167_g1_i2:46-966(+)